MKMTWNWFGKQRGKRGRLAKHDRRRTIHLGFGEPLEARTMLAVDPVISEFLAANSNTLNDGNGVSSDWIEIHNAGDVSINLVDWYLTDNAADLTKWPFPSVVLNADQYLVVFASGNGVPDTAGNLHTNFNLSSKGEYLGLVRPDGTTLASEFLAAGATYPDQVSDISYGTNSANVLRFFDPPTPGAINGDGFAGFAGDTQFSHDRGHYDAPFSLRITSETSAASIYYTTDGSLPSASNGTLYTFPLTISTTTTLRAIAIQDGYRASNVDAQTYIFLNDVLKQDPKSGPNAAIYPNQWQASVTGDYAVDPEVVATWDDNNPANDDFGIRSALKSIPTMSIVMDHNDLWGPAGTGIYTDAERRIRKPGSIEYFDPKTGDQFQYNVGVQMHGNASRDNVRLLKHSFRLIFSPEFDGPGRLTFPIFNNSNFADINTLILRASFTDAFATRTATDRYSPMDSTYTRDVWMRETQIAMGSLSADNTFVHLYINGLYWGMYNPSEKADAAFYAAHDGGQPEDWDVIKDFDELDSGNKTAWDQMFTLSNQLSTAADPDSIYWQLQGMNRDGTDNPDLPNLLDMENLIDYMILHLSTGPEDWPHHNWHAGRNRVNPGKGFQFQTWDQEIVLDGRFRDKTEAADKGPAQLHSRLQNSPEYLRHFGDRVQLHMFNGGALTVEANQARWLAIANQVEAAIIGESARWGDAREGQRITVSTGQPQVTVPTLTVDHWRETIADVSERQFEIYHSMALDWFRADGLFPGLNTVEFNQYGGEVSTGFQVTMNSPGSVVVEEAVLHTQGDDVLAFVPVDDSLETGVGPHWFDTEFDASGWIAGTSGVGFEDTPSSLADLIETDVSTDWNAHESSVYTRIEFQLDDGFDADTVQKLMLRLKYDDGFVAYLNGQVVASDRAPESPNWDSNATGSRISILSTIFFGFDITEHSQRLQPGRNVLAIQALNRSDTDGDLLVMPELLLTRTVALDSPPIYYTTNGEDPRLLGGELNPAAQRYLDDVVIDKTTRIKARANVGGLWSALVDPIFVVVPSGSHIVVSEINYNPVAPSVAEVTALPGVTASDFEFVEILNSGPSAIGLDGIQLTNGVAFDFSASSFETLAAGERLVVVANQAAFAQRYGSGIPIAGEFTGSLANGGERLTLSDGLGRELFSVAYGDAEQWPQAADGAGATLELVDPTSTTALTSDKYYSWQSSREFGGTPGTAGAGPVGVVINEVLASTDESVTVSDSIELFNATNSAVDIGGWFLSDSTSNFQKFMIPTGTILAAGDYVVFDETDFNVGVNGFALSGVNGDDVWLSAPGTGGEIGWLVDDVHFGGAASLESLGRVPNGSGRLVPLLASSLGAANGEPRIGPVVIGEVQYNAGEPTAAAVALYPPLNSGDLEFIELHNPTAATVDLTDWMIRGGVDLAFVAGTQLAAGETVVVVSFNPDNPSNVGRVAAFQEFYSIDAAVRLLGGFSGQLSDGGDRVELQRAVHPDAAQPLVIAHVTEDEVLFDDLAPWAVAADGQGSSLQRVAVAAYGNASGSWSATTASPGAVDFDGAVRGDVTGDGIVNAADIDAMYAAINANETDSLYDLNGDRTVTIDDATYLISTVLGTFRGDANLDGKVDAADLNAVGLHWTSGGNGWATGDFTGDGIVDAMDLNAVGINWLKMAATRAPRAPLAAVAKAKRIDRTKIDAVHAYELHPANPFRTHIYDGS